MDVSGVVMLVAGGMFAGGAAVFSWSRIPIWRSMPMLRFGDDFAATIRRTDKVQPALLIVAIVSSLAFAWVADGVASVFAWVGAAGFMITLIASVAILVPLQRRIITLAYKQDSAVEDMRLRWYSGHLGRSLLSTASFASLAVAAVA